MSGVDSGPRFGARGEAFWRATMGHFELTDAEMATLFEACRTLDALDELAAVVARDGLMVTGSTGQPVVHPAVAEARQQRVTLARLLRALALPDVEEEPRSPAAYSERARYAAQSRWKGHTRKAVG